jgi:broad specificity phosphatase PhoE
VGVLLLLRHGQASLGSANYDELSDLGRRQARAAGDRLAKADLDIGHVVCGSLVRQRDTALETLSRLGRTADILAVDGRLDEYDHVGVLAAHSSGVSFEGATSADANRAVQPALEEAIMRWATTDGDYPERYDQFIERAVDAVSELLERPGTTLAITSGGVIAVASAHVLGLPVERWPVLARMLVNGSITKILRGRSGVANLSTFNDHAHFETDRSMITYR